MTIEARKIQLIERVMHLDEHQLEKLENFLTLETSSELSASLDRALQDVRDGRVTPHEEVRKQYEKWL